MGIYDAAKDAVKLAQKLDNVELVMQLLDVQEQALEMQEKQFELNKKIAERDEEITALKEKKKYTYEEGHTWKVLPERPDIKLCPVCLDRDGFENPTTPNGSRQYCYTCKKEFK